MEKILKNIERSNIAVTASVVLVTGILFSRNVAAGFMAGSFLMALNFYAFRQGIKFLASGKASRKLLSTLFLVIKQSAILIGVVAFLKFIPMNILAFVGGISIVLFSIIFSSILSIHTAAN